jgi:hypothetical protein
MSAAARIPYTPFTCTCTSVRISSKKQYNTGLFILDINRAPWGCAVWPAWWTLGGNWPYVRLRVPSFIT